MRTVFSQKKSTWRSYVGHYDVGLNSVLGRDWVRWNACVATKFLDGDAHVPNLYRNDEKRRLGRNRWTNEWNSNNQFLAVRNDISLLTAPKGAAEFF